MAYHPLARLLDLDEGFRRVCRVGDREILLICSDGQTHLIDRSCPHAGSPLDRAAVRDGCITCPRHGVRFDLVSGEALNASCAKLAVYRPVYDGATLGLDA